MKKSVKKEKTFDTAEVVKKYSDMVIKKSSKTTTKVVKVKPKTKTKKK